MGDTERKRERERVSQTIERKRAKETKIKNEQLARRDKSKTERES